MTESELRVHLKAKMADVSLESLPAFIDDALERGKGDYGTICVAIGAIAAAAAKAADRSPSGGITGFQAGAVFWEFQKQWGVFGDGPMRMVCFSEMLYPQYQKTFASTISPETWEWLQEQAKRHLAEISQTAHPDVVAHWESIAAGMVPFGYAVQE